MAVNPYAYLPGRPSMAPYKLAWDGKPQRVIACPFCLLPAVWWSEDGCSDGVSYLIVCPTCIAAEPTEVAA